MFVPSTDSGLHRTVATAAGHGRHRTICLRRRPADQASTGRQFRLALRQRQIPLLVPQPRRQVHLRAPKSSRHRLRGSQPRLALGGVEANTPDGKTIRWSQPEIVLYDDDPMLRMSYPDLVEDGGYFLTETQKNVARVHPIDSKLIEGLWSQFDAPENRLRAAMFVKSLKDGPIKGFWNMKPLPAFIQRDNTLPDHGSKDSRRGFTVEASIRPTSDDGIFVLHNRDVWFRGFRSLSFGNSRSFELRFDDGRTNCRWESDKYVWKLNEWTHVVAIVDGGPKIVRFVVNGRLCDGGDQRQFGWGRFSPHYRGPQGGELDVERKFPAEFARVRISTKALTTSEAVNDTGWEWRAFKSKA